MKNPIIIMALAGLLAVSCAGGGNVKTAPEQIYIIETVVVPAPSASSSAPSQNKAVVDPSVHAAERNSIVTLFDGEFNDFVLNIKTNKTVYYDNENLRVILSSSEHCYFMVYHMDVFNNIQIIYPNPLEMHMNYLEANIERTIPENTDFRLHEPFGEERILVFASDKPINVPMDRYGEKKAGRDYLEDFYTTWLMGDGNQPRKDMPRCATGQVIYTILPR